MVILHGKSKINKVYFLFCRRYLFYDEFGLFDKPISIPNLSVFVPKCFLSSFVTKPKQLF